MQRKNLKMNMSFKKILKNVLGEQFLSNMKGHVYHYGCLSYFILSGKQKLIVDSDQLELYRILEEEKKHVFRGYYDLDYYSASNDRFLCHRLPFNAQNNKSTDCEIGYYSLKTGTWESIATTNAWCWQQGSRLRWHPVDQEKIVFNAVEGCHYCAKVIDVNSKMQIQLLDWPLYDVTPDFHYGLSLNFSRLQRLRPGYGYNFFPDNTVNDCAPENDGVWLVDLKQNNAHLIYSLQKLAERVNDWKMYEHYINHISISPDGNKFLFFHIYTKNSDKEFKVILYVSDIQGHNLTALESIDRASHYCWIDNDRIMVTLKKEDGSEYYAIYGLESRNKRVLSISQLNCDGHPGVFARVSQFVTDTYPLKHSLQHLRTFNLETNQLTNLADIYHDYRMRGEIRCDLHPSVTADGAFISVDSTYHRKKRCVIILKNHIGN